MFARGDTLLIAVDGVRNLPRTSDVQHFAGLSGVRRTRD